MSLLQFLQSYLLSIELFWIHFQVGFPLVFYGVRDSAIDVNLDGDILELLVVSMMDMELHGRNF